MNYTLNLLSDNSERIPYNYHPDIPAYINKGKLSNFLNFTAPSHWHDDVELSIILSGRMSYNINGTIYTLERGNGIFVNSRQFHSNFSVDGSTDCEYICVLFHPVLLCANQYLEKSCIIPVISNNAFPYTILHQGIPWQSELLGNVQRIYQISNKRSKVSDLLLQSLFFHIWSILHEHMPDVTKSPVRSDARFSTLREMMGFLHKHYNEKITLSDIAAAGKVCQSNCSVIFSEYLHQTPIQYLIEYRLNKSVAMLKNTSLNITEIALASGFSGVSYYTETFRKHFGRSPSEYRKCEALDSKTKK